MKITGTYRVVTIGVSLLIMFILFQFGKEFKTYIADLFSGGNGGFDNDVEPPKTPVPPIATSNGFDSQYYVSRLIEVLTESYYWSASPRCEAYKEFNEVNDAEFVIVCNEFATQQKKSLRSAIEDTYVSGCIYHWQFLTTSEEDVLQRMKDLGVYG